FRMAGRDTAPVGRLSPGSEVGTARSSVGPGAGGRARCPDNSGPPPSGTAARLGGRSAGRGPRRRWPPVRAGARGRGGAPRGGPDRGANGPAPGPLRQTDGAAVRPWGATTCGKKRPLRHPARAWPRGGPPPPDAPRFTKRSLDPARGARDGQFLDGQSAAGPVGSHGQGTDHLGRVEEWRGGLGRALRVAGPFVCRCPSSPPCPVSTPRSSVGSRAGAVPRRPGLAVAPRFLWECLISPAVG